jgi:hypothetical protein
MDFLKDHSVNFIARALELTEQSPLDDEQHWTMAAVAICSQTIQTSRPTTLELENVAL